MKNTSVNILDSIIFGFIKNVSSSEKCLIDCNKNKIDSIYHLSLLYVQYDYLVNTDSNSLAIIKTLDDIIASTMFLEKIKLFIEKNYNCDIPDDVFQEVIQEVISVIKCEIQPTKIQ